MKTMKHIDLNDSIILVTGSVGFIGANLIRRLLRELDGSFLIGVDNLNNYYDISLKEFRLWQIAEETEKQKAQQKIDSYFKSWIYQNSEP